MKKIEIVVKDRPQLSNPILICGLPDTGLVAKLAIEKFLQVTRAKCIAEIYSTYFSPETVIETDGTIRLIRNELYHARIAQKDFDVLVYTGDSQPYDPQGAYELADQILDVAKSLGIRESIVLAALITGEEVSKPMVHATATDFSIVEDYRRKGIEVSSEGNITWMHGLLLGLSALKGIKAVCLASETPGDRRDPLAASALIKVLEKILGVDLSSGELERERDSTPEVGPKTPETGDPDKTKYIA